MDDLELDPADFKVPLYALLLIFLLCWTPSVFSEPTYQTFTEDGAVITLHNDKCVLEEVKNLPYRITWVEKGETTEGCYGAKGPFVIFYFLDKTVGVIPAHVFQKVIGA